MENLIKIGFQQIERELPAVFFSFKEGGICECGSYIKGQSRQNFDDFLIYNIRVELVLTASALQILSLVVLFKLEVGLIIAFSFPKAL